MPATITGSAGNVRRGRRRSLNQCSRDWVQSVLHVYLVVCEFPLTSKILLTSICLNQTSICFVFRSVVYSSSTATRHSNGINSVKLIEDSL